jgi:hypothetical protein
MVLSSCSSCQHLALNLQRRSAQVNQHTHLNDKAHFYCQALHFLQGNFDRNFLRIFKMPEQRPTVDPYASRRKDTVDCSEIVDYVLCLPRCEWRMRTRSAHLLTVSIKKQVSTASHWPVSSSSGSILIANISSKSPGELENCVPRTIGLLTSHHRKVGSGRQGRRQNIWKRNPPQ